MPINKAGLILKLMGKLIFLFFFLLFSGGINSQTITNLHIVTTPRNHLPGFPNFHFSVNNNAYKLSAGQCLELSISADSVNIVVEDKRLVKKDSDDLHLSASKDLYVWIRVTWTGNYKNPRYGAEVVCKTCFEELKQKCKKTITE
jgi:hypothetical protein